MVRRMVPFWVGLLHAEGGHELNAARVTHAEDAPPRRLYSPNVSAGIALRVRCDIGQSRAWSLQEQAAHSGAESMVGKRSRQFDVGRGSGHNGRAAARRAPRCLLDPSGNRGGGQQRRFEVDSCASRGRDCHLAATGVRDLEHAGKRPFKGEDKAEIGGAHRISGKRGNVEASSKGLRIGAELQEQSGVWRLRLVLRATGAVVCRGVKRNGPHRDCIFA